MLKVVDVTSRKNLSVLQFVSNCVTHSKRELYTQELARHIDVDKFGSCGGQRCTRDSACETTQIGEHRNRVL
jgi:hypothetical protein